VLYRYTEHGEEHTYARNNGVLSIEVCFKKKTCMRRSKLEMEIDILNMLAQKGPLKVTHLMYKTNVNCDVLSKNLVSLIKQGLIQKRLVGKGSNVYSITGLGLTLLKSWKELKQLLPAVENENEVHPLFRNTVSIRV
jgi:predicted transcriptional regulator